MSSTTKKKKKIICKSFATRKYETILLNMTSLQTAPHNTTKLMNQETHFSDYPSLALLKQDIENLKVSMQNTETMKEN